MHSNQLRQKFRNFFLSKKHIEISSASLIPDKSDPTVLLTTAGMQPLVPYLMGAKHPKGKRLFNTQKCFRTPDIDEVGDDTHHTFFEMLGNWSLGDYFKEEAIELAYDFFVDVLGLDPKRFAITIFKGDKDAPQDEEAEKIWLSKGLKKEQIFEFSKKDNFWGPAGKTGPCGPCSEIHYDRGEQYGENFGPNSDKNQRYVEIWNLVFMEYNKKEDGSYEKLAQKNVDTGVGFERLLSILSNKDSAFDTDLFANILKMIEKVSGKKFNVNNKRSFRIIADHIRGATFLIADGVIPGNTGREYILKRIIRRAIMHGQKIGIKNVFTSLIAKIVVKEYQQYYPELEERKKHIFSTFNIEEENFLKTLQRGKKILDEIISKKKKIVSGIEAFELFDTYGFPIELTKEIAEEKGISIDIESFEKEMEKQKMRSKAGAVKMFERDEDLSAFEKVPATIFDCDKYESTEKILYAQRSKNEKNAWYIALEKTPFYAESGGQIADKGTIEVGDVKAKIIDVQKNPNRVFIHKISSLEKDSRVPTFVIGMRVFVKIDQERNQIKKHHSATHLLHAALRKVLGNHVEQAGSEVVKDRTRFDFTHPKNLNKKELKAVEDQIALWVAEAHPAKVVHMPIEEARKKGAMALFSDKFEQGAHVRTIKFADISFELCGGTHVDNTAEIGAVKIISECSIASGVRRIEMVCSLTAQKLLQEKCNRIENFAEILKTQSEKLEERIDLIIKERKEIEQKLKITETIIADLEAEKIIASAYSIQGKKVGIIIDYEDSLNVIGQIVRKTLEKDIKSDVFIVISKKGDIAIATKGDISARNLLKKITDIFGGGGGGSENFAQGGGVKNPNEKQIQDIVKEFL